MSAQDRVQSYLNRHKVPCIFEDMMSKLVSAMPVDPYGFLIELLQIKRGKSRSSSKEVEVTGGKTGGSVWNNKGDYDKPWRTKSKKRTSAAPPSDRKAEWDKTVKMTINTYDEMQEPTNMKAHKAGPAPLVQREPSPNRSYLVKSEDELLADEFPQARVETVQDEVNTGPSATASSRRNKNPKTDSLNHQKSDSLNHRKSDSLNHRKSDSLNHQKSLREFINQKRKEKSQYIDPAPGRHEDSDVESGIEIYENAEDLRDEGIQVSPEHKDRPAKMQRGRVTPDTCVQVIVCATCAKIMNRSGDTKSDGSVSSSSTKSSQRSVSRLSESVWASHRAPANEPPRLQTRASNDLARSTGRVATERTGYSSRLEDEDDEFESVSQVSGQQPRVPIWHDSDEEDLTPRKGTSMLRKSPTRLASGEKKVTLREEMLQTLPPAKNTVEEFLGNNTWSGELSPPRRNQATRKSMDARLTRSPPRSHQDEKRPHGSLSQSYDTLTGGRNTGWRVERDSEGESTIVP